MYANENFRKIVKIFIFTLMCSLLDSTFTQQNAAQNRSPYYTRSANGTQVNTENAKFLASIRLKAFDKIFGDGHICSGALIAPSVVLTVAQCVHNYNNDEIRHPSEIKVVMGTISRYELNPDTLSMSVTHIYQPKTFDPQGLKDNLAILMLEKDVPNDHPVIQPIALETEATANALDVPFEYISWGTTKEGLPVDQALLLNSSRTGDIDCLSALYPVHTSSICFSTDRAEENICPSDAGAPLIFNNRLQGLASLGQGCWVGVLPVVFTNISHHSQWIHGMIGDGGNQNGSLWGTLGLLIFTLYAIKTSKFFKAL